MTKTINIRDYTLNDIKEGILHQLQIAASSMEVRQHAIEITADKQDKITAVFDWVKQNVQYVPDPMGIELFMSPRRMIEDYNNGHAIAEDCVYGDTPVWVQKGHGIPELSEVRELLPLGNHALFDNVNILTSEGLKPLIAVKRKKSRKPLVRLTSSSDIIMTEDHKIVTNRHIHGSERYTSAKDIDKGQLIKVYPEFENTEGSKDDYDIGWAYGFFYADGDCMAKVDGDNRWGSWGIGNTDTDHLEKAQSIFENLFPYLRFPIKDYPSNHLPTNYGPRRKPLLVMVAQLRSKHNNGEYRDGTLMRFAESQRALFYNPYKIKRVPAFVLHGSVDLAKGFWDGAKVGDGWEPDVISSGSRLASYGLACINTKLGYNTRVGPDGRHATVHRRSNSKGAAAYDGNIHKSSIHYSGSSDVYDITTATGDFVAGDVLVKNCDGHAMLLTALYRSIGMESHVYLVDCIGQGFDHALCVVWSDKFREWIHVDTTTEYPLGWIIRYSKGVFV